MTTQHNDSAAEALVQQTQAHSLRSRLLMELDDLERTLAGVRDLVNELPPAQGASGGTSQTTVTETKTRRWTLWKHL